DKLVTGVQTCALPIYVLRPELAAVVASRPAMASAHRDGDRLDALGHRRPAAHVAGPLQPLPHRARNRPAISLRRPTRCPPADARDRKSVAQGKRLPIR